MREMASTDASRGKLSEAIGFARYAGERTLITMRGEAVAALVSLQDLAQLEGVSGANVCSPPGTAPAAQGENRG